MAADTIPAKRKRTNPSGQLQLAGRIFGRLTAIEKTDYRVNKKVMWLCRCVCGRHTTVMSSNLTSGHVKSCGCTRKETLKTHGQSKTAEYMAWHAMWTRCTNTKQPYYHRYGGRGITVCERWDTYPNFMADMGTCPSGHELDRINNDGDYTPDNCRWATKKQQYRNKSTNRLLTFNGETMCLVDWAERTGIGQKHLSSRLSLGWSVERTLTQPVGPARFAKGHTGFGAAKKPADK